MAALGRARSVSANFTVESLVTLLEAASERGRITDLAKPLTGFSLASQVAKTRASRC